MALAQFRNQAKNIEITKKMGAPKKMTMEGWFKATRKMIPQIPNPKDSDWIITHEFADTKAQWIKFELVNSIGEKCQVIIDRKVPFIGAN